jgi:3-phosphoglycerate kinase
MLRTLSKLKKKEITGKTAIVRIDINAGNASESAFRISAVLPTIQFLLQRRVKKIVLLAHRGRPTEEYQKELSLEPFAPFLAEKIGEEIDFVAAYRLGAFRKAAAESSARIILLENMRFFTGENTNDPTFARELAKLGDVYVNDAFSVSHRKHASIVAITKYLPSYTGLQFEKELKALDTLKKKIARPFTLIIGGTKVSDKTGIITVFQDKADAILVGGRAANTLFAARGDDVGSSKIENDFLAKAKKLLKIKTLHLPIDCKRADGKILDIGSKTIVEWKSIIAKSKTIIWSGTPGLIEKAAFAKGTEEIARAIVAGDAYSIVGGGDTVAFVSKLGLLDRFSFVSTGGSAMFEYLSGKKLPGIIALEK